MKLLLDFTIVLLLLLLCSFSHANLIQTKQQDNFEFIILHNNDMHARFEQTGVYSNKCQPDDVLTNNCYGGFARVAYK